MPRIWRHTNTIDPLNTSSGESESEKEYSTSESFRIRNRVKDVNVEFVAVAPAAAASEIGYLFVAVAVSGINVTDIFPIIFLAEPSSLCIYSVHVSDWCLRILQNSFAVYRQRYRHTVRNGAHIFHTFTYLKFIFSMLLVSRPLWNVAQRWTEKTCFASSFNCPFFDQQHESSTFNASHRH